MAFDNTGARLTRRAALLWHASAVFLLGTLVACASGPTRPPTGTPDPDRFLFERGSEELKDRKWLTAREYFRQLIDVYPQSPYRASAKLGIGDTYLGEGTAEAYVLGINEFREFLSYYPTHRDAHYAQYKLGMAHYYQMRAPARDQTETREAIRELTTFVERYPNSPVIDEGRARLREARDRLSESEYRVGLTYHRMKWYPGALERFRGVLANDPEFTHRDAVYFYLAEALERIQRPAEALPYYERLLKEFEKSEFLEDARKRADAIKAAMAGTTGTTGSLSREVVFA
jgi:outer membrane protein assembly factor BamD